MAELGRKILSVPIVLAMILSLFGILALSPIASGQGGDAPGEDLSDVPRYPESVRTEYRVDYLWTGAECYIEYQTTDGCDAIQDFYLGEMPTYGWTLVEQEKILPGENFERPFWYGIFRKGDVEVLVRASEDDPAPHITLIMVTYTTPSAENLPPIEVSIEHHSPGEIKSYEIDNFYVESITITAENEISGALLNIQPIGNVLDNEIPEAPVDVLYYFDITTGAENDIREAVIEFRVPKELMESLDIDKEMISIFRYSENWVELQTSLTGREDENCIYYSAKIKTGFSIFAIGYRCASPPAEGISLAAVLAIVGAVLVAIVSARWVYLRQARGEATSVLIEHGLSSMSIRDADIFREIRSRKEFTIPELMRETGASTLVAWRAVQKLIEKGLVKPTGKVKPAEAGRGKPSTVYKYASD